MSEQKAKEKEGVYVVVVENDKPVTMPSGRVFHDDGGPLIFEQYTRHADHASIQERAKALASKYGRARIARLEFTGEEFGGEQ